MIEKELIKRVCDVTCSKEDVVRPQDTIAYDPNNPFKKYYHIESIIMAINKYVSHEWDDQTLAHWACIYCWILCGGFKNVKEKLNSLEQFLKDDITWSLDGLSFFDESYFEEEDAGPADLIEAYKTIDYIWKTRENWRGVYAMVGPKAEFNQNQYVVLINDTTKEYIIIYSDYLENGFEDEYFQYVSEKKFIHLIEQLKEKKYTILCYSEGLYYDEISK